MTTWQEAIGGQPFITDMRRSRKACIDGEPVEVGRYAVWLPVPDTDRHQVVEVGDDLAQLCEKYAVSTANICAVML